jgi:UDP-N-acetylglucosamine 3-dehydrogenase
MSFPIYTDNATTRQEALEDTVAKLHIGIIGAGGMGKVHAAAYRKLPEVAVAAVADTDRARGEALAAEFGTQYVANYHAMFDQVDAVSICLPHTLHRAACEAAATAGKHILCEKPLATTVADCAAIIAAARSVSSAMTNATQQMNAVLAGA